LYTKECNLEIGRLVKTEKDRKQQIDGFKKIIELKDIAIDTSNKRTTLWKETTYKVEDRLIKLDKSSETIKWLYFGLGMVAMTGAVYAAGRLK